NRLGHLLAERFALVGLFNVDFVRTADELWPVEVNPRYSASIEVLERAFHRSFINAHIQASLGNLCSVASPLAIKQFAGKATVYARQHGSVIGAEFEKLISLWNLPGQLPGTADVPRTGERFAAGQPVVTVLSAGTSMTEVEAKLRQRVAIIESALVQDRV